MESIVFRWPQADNNYAEWLSIDANGRPHISLKSGSLDELSRQLRGQGQKKQAIILLPAQYYSLFHVTLPPKINLNNIKKAAPYAIADDLAVNIDSYHFVCSEVSKTDSETIAKVIAVNRDALHTLLATLAEQQVTPKFIYAENTLLPESNEVISIFVENGTLHTRLQDNVTHSLPIDLLPSLLSEISDDKQIKIVSNQVLDVDQYQSREIELVQSDTPLLNTLAKQLQTLKPVNLLQGEFKYQEELGKHFAPWRWPLAFAAVALILAFATQLLAVHKLEKKNTALEDEKVAIYKTAFPRSRNIDVYSVRTRMEQALKKMGGNTATSSQFIPLLEQYAKLGDSAVAINNIDYSKDKLSLTLLAKDIQILDQIKINLEKNKGIAANIYRVKR